MNQKHSATSVAQFFQSVKMTYKLNNYYLKNPSMSPSECLHNNIKFSLLTVMGYFIKNYIQYIRENMQVLKLIRIKMNWKYVNSKLIGIWELIPSPIYSFTKTSRLFDIIICLVIVRILAPFSLKRTTTLYPKMYVAMTAWQTKQKMMIHICSGAFQSPEQSEIQKAWRPGPKVQQQVHLQACASVCQPCLALNSQDSQMTESHFKNPANIEWKRHRIIF